MSLTIALDRNKFNAIFHRLDSNINLSKKSLDNTATVERTNSITLRCHEFDVNLSAKIIEVDENADNFECKIELLVPSGINKFIITGGPGFGKSSLLNYLSNKNYQVFYEAALRAVHSGVKPETEVKTWDKRDHFNKMVQEIMEHDYVEHNIKMIGLFDRGFPDFIGWMKYYNENIESAYQDIYNHPYEKLVFVTKPWKSIHTTNDNRPFSFNESSLINKELIDGYRLFDYEIEYLPNASVEERGEFVSDKINQYLIDRYNV